MLLCSKHHHVVHLKGWHLELKPDGTVEVTDPQRPHAAPATHPAEPQPPARLRRQTLVMAGDRAVGRGARGRAAVGGAHGVLAVGAAALYGLAPQIFDVWAQVPELRVLGWVGLVAMLGCELVSFVCAWGLHRVALPGLSWFGAGTTQLTSNAVSRAVPGGARWAQGCR